MANKTITLTKPIVGHETVRELELREPTWNEYSELGDPFVWAPRGDDMVVATPIMDRVKAYAERLVLMNGREGDPLILGQLCLADSRAVKDAVLGFFLAAEKATEASPSSSTTSSSSSDGVPATSGT